MKYLKIFEAFKIIIAYHGTPNGGFNKFEYDKRGKGADQNGYGDWGNGFYFTTSKKTAISYAEGLTEWGIGNKPYVYTVNLKINNPFSFKKLYQFDKALWEKIRQNNNSGKKEGEILNISDEQYNELLVKINTTDEELEFMRDLESHLSDNWGDFDIAGKLKEKGYDSIIANEDSKHGNEIVVFDSEQIQILKKEPITMNKLIKKYRYGIDKKKFK